MVELLPDQSAHMTEIKKTILKIFHALIQYILPMDLIKEDDFIKWMEILQHVVQQDIPAEANSDDIDEEDKPQLIWWKQKKWALHTLTRVFERYGSPGKKLREINFWHHHHVISRKNCHCRKCCVRV